MRNENNLPSDVGVWIQPADLETYNLDEAFQKDGDRTVTWGFYGGKGIHLSDLVYMYMSGKGGERIRYKCKVVRVDVPEHEAIGMEYWLKGGYDPLMRQMNIQLLTAVDDEGLSLDNLRRNGLSYKDPMAGKRDIKKNEQLHCYIESVFSKHQMSDGHFIKTIDNELFKLPSDLEKEAVIRARVGQGRFRDKLIDQYRHACMICGIQNRRLLIASHIKPWSESTDDEKLDADNGLLLCANHDALFDSHLISFDKKGQIVLSLSLNTDDLSLIFETTDVFLPVNDKTMEYLQVHFNEMQRLEDERGSDAH